MPSWIIGRLSAYLLPRLARYITWVNATAALLHPGRVTAFDPRLHEIHGLAPVIRTA